MGEPVGGQPQIGAQLSGELGPKVDALRIAVARVLEVEDPLYLPLASGEVGALQASDSRTRAMLGRTATMSPRSAVHAAQARIAAAKGAAM